MSVDFLHTAKVLYTSSLSSIRPHDIVTPPHPCPSRYSWSRQPLHIFHTYTHMHTCCSVSPICIGYRLRWRSDIWRTDRGVAEVRSPGIRPATDDDIRHNAPGLLETVDELLRTKVRRKLQNQDKPSRLASYALQQHKAKSARPRLAASEFSFLLAVWDALGGCVQWSRRETKTLKLQQATEELGRERTARVTTMAWCLTL